MAEVTDSLLLTAVFMALPAIVFAGVCPEGTNEHRGSCYTLHPQKITHAKAVVECQKTDSYLLTIESQHEAAFLLKHYSKKRLHLGLKAAEQGRYKWSNNKYLDKTAFTNWMDNQPDNWEGREECVQWWGDRQGQWDDRPCRETLPFICKRDTGYYYYTPQRATQKDVHPNKSVNAPSSKPPVFSPAIGADKKDASAQMFDGKRKYDNKLEPNLNDVHKLLLKEIGKLPLPSPPPVEPTLKHTSHLKGCEGVAVVNVGRHVQFQSCYDVCHSHGANFYAPTSFQSGSCLDDVPGAAESSFWINTVQFLPNWGQSSGSRLMNLMTNHYVPNYSPTVDRNKPNGIRLVDGTSRGRGLNCIYSLQGQYYGTKCQHGAEPMQCACQVSGGHHEDICRRVEMLDTDPNRPGILAAECVSLCAKTDRDFYAPRSLHEFTCLEKVDVPTWVNLVQIFPIPDSKTFPMLYNLMSRQLQHSYSSRTHVKTPFEVESIPPEGVNRGIGQNCVFYAKNQNAKGTLLHGTNCETERRVRSCACLKRRSSQSPPVGR